MSTQAQSREDLSVALGEETAKRQLRIPHRLTIELDPDVEAVLAFMLENFEAPKLVDIAQAVNELAKPLFGRLKNESNIYTKRFIPVSLYLEF